VTLASTSYTRAAIVRVDSNYIIFVVTAIATSDIKVVVIGIDNNTSSNNCTIVNINTRKTTIDFAYNRELDIGSI